MCFIEYNWMVNAWQFRIGQTFTDWRGTRSLDSLNEWKELLARDNYTLTKTDSRTYQLVNTKINATI